MVKGIKVALSDGWAERVRARVSQFVVGTVKNALDELLDWLIRHGIRFGIAAAALITAVVLAMTAAKEGIVALGVHPALASAGLALVAGLVGYFLFKAGRPRRVRPRQRKRRSHVYDVHRSSDGWEVTGHGRSRPRTFASKRDAVRAAERDAAHNGGTRIVIHRSDGSVQETEHVGGGGDDRVK